ncbi:4'-phosphopantetheinyl transferase family protein [Bounagaea algeriensis]
MIEKVLPPGVAAAETTADAEKAHLFPEEEQAIARAVAERRREFTTGRWCARLAMARLGIAPLPVPRGHRGMPVWPPDVLGSITHCTGFRAAAVARSEQLPDVLGIGIDAEPHDALPGGVFDVITTTRDRALLHELSLQDSSFHWGRVLFCAKEAVFKAWYPATHRWLEFDEADIDLHERGFTARLLRAPDHGTRIEGRWFVENGLVLTALLLPRAALARSAPPDAPEP